MKQIIFENCSIEDKIKSIINSDKTSRKKRMAKIRHTQKQTLNISIICKLTYLPLPSCEVFVVPKPSLSAF